MEPVLTTESKFVRSTRPEDRNARARHYHRRAKVIRTLADDFRPEESRLMLVSLANSYQHMAEILDAMR